MSNVRIELNFQSQFKLKTKNRRWPFEKNVGYFSCQVLLSLLSVFQILLHLKRPINLLRKGQLFLFLRLN